MNEHNIDFSLQASAYFFKQRQNYFVVAVEIIFLSGSDQGVIIMILNQNNIY